MVLKAMHRHGGRPWSNGHGLGRPQASAKLIQETKMEGPKTAGKALLKMLSFGSVSVFVWRVNLGSAYRT